MLLLAAPGRLIESVTGTRATPAVWPIARVLGARHLLQAAAGIAGSRIALRAWWVDALHSMSMVGVALAAPGDRGLAAADALVAAAFATATYSASS